MQKHAPAIFILFLFIAIIPSGCSLLWDVGKAVVREKMHISDTTPVYSGTFSLDYYPQNPVVHEGVQFSLSARETSLSWDFGDGASAFTDSHSICHAYSKPGDYQVTVSSGGTTNRKSAIVTVHVSDP